MDECVRVLDSMPERNPTDGTFELTIRCNLHCKMCLFRHDDSENAEIKSKELTAGQWIDMARQAAEAGTLSLLITGGEPLLRPDFCEIWEGIYKQGFVITLYTNATLVTDKVMETLRKYPPHRIGITFYGSNPEIYEKVTGNAKAFGLAIQGTRKLMQLPSEKIFRMTIIQDNFSDMDEIEELVHREFGRKYMVTASARVHQSVRGGCADAASCRLSPEDNIRMLFRKNIAEIKRIVGDSYDEKYLSLSSSESENETTGEEHITLYGCNAGMDSYTISYSGELFGCQLLGMFSTDPLRDSFREAWNQYPFTVQLPEKNPKCLSCENRKYCESCYACRYAETGDLEGIPEYSCEQAKIIKKLVDKQEVTS